MGDGGGNPFTPGGGNPFTPDRGGANGGGPMAGGEASPSAVSGGNTSMPESTKPRQMPGGDSGGMDMGMGGMGADPMGGGGDTNVPQQSAPPMDKAAVLRRITADILVTNPALSTRQAGLLAEEVLARYPKVAAAPRQQQFPIDPDHPLADPNHPYWQYLNQQRTAPGGRGLQAHPQSNYPYIEDAMNKATEWGVNKVREKFQQRKQRNTGDAPPTPEQGSQPPPVPAVAPPAGPWVPPVAPAGAPAATPAPNGFRPAPLPTPAAPAPAPAPSRAQQLRNRVMGPKGRHAASVVYGSED